MSVRVIGVRAPLMEGPGGDEEDRKSPRANTPPGGGGGLSIFDQGNQYGDFDRIEGPHDESSATCWERWKWRAAHIAGTGVSFGLRLMNYGRIANIGGNLGIGFFGHAAVTSGHAESALLNRIRQITTTLLGQATLFGLTQIYFNTKNGEVREAITQTIMVMLGANIESVAHWLFLKGANREESHDVAQFEGDRLNRTPFLGEKLSWFLKGGASAALFTLSKEVSDPILQGLSSFGAFFYLSQVVGEIAIQSINRAIETYGVKETTHSVDVTKTRLRLLKTVLTTIPAFIPMFFIPWQHNPDTQARIEQLWWVGASIGALDGMVDKSKRERFDRTPIESLEELSLIEPHPLWDWGVPIGASLAFMAFMVWQEIWDLQDPDAKAGLAANGGAFFGTLAASKFIDWAWDPKVRNQWKDKAMYFVTVSPRVLGMNPFYFYLAGTNTLDMTSQAIKGEKNDLYTTLIIASWAAYGFSMALELHSTSSRRIRGLLLRLQQMAMANALTMTHLYKTGVIN